MRFASSSSFALRCTLLLSNVRGGPLQLLFLLRLLGMGELADLRGSLRIVTTCCCCGDATDDDDALSLAGLDLLLYWFLIAISLSILLLLLVLLLAGLSERTVPLPVPPFRTVRL